MLLIVLTCKHNLSCENNLTFPFDLRVITAELCKPLASVLFNIY